MPPSSASAVLFGPFNVTTQIFYRTKFSFGLVNIKPLLPGHVLVCPHRIVPRLRDLDEAEITDLFLTVQRVGKMVERVFQADALTIGIQDGEAAGQSVSHVHTHIIPRKMGDLDQKGGNDVIYEMLQSDDADLGKQMRAEPASNQRGAFKVDNEERLPRSEEEMVKEAEWLAAEMSKDGL